MTVPHITRRSLVGPSLGSDDGKRQEMLAVVRRLGQTRFGIWAVKHLIAPIDRWCIRRSGAASSSNRLGPILLLTTTGRKSGQSRTTPVFYTRAENERLVIRNVRPPAERSNPWVANVQANPNVEVQIGRQSYRYTARGASQVEVEQYWPQLVSLWPAYDTFLKQGGKRTIFILEPKAEPSNGASAKLRRNLGPPTRAASKV